MQFALFFALEGTAHYAGLLIAPAEDFGIRPRLLWPLAKPVLAFGQGFELWVVQGIQKVPQGPT